MMFLTFFLRWLNQKAKNLYLFLFFKQSLKNFTGAADMVLGDDSVPTQ